MATRKGKGKQAVRTTGGGIPGWGWAIIGIAVGAILMAVVTHGSLFSSLQKPEIPQANPQATAEHPGDTGVVAPGSSASAPKKPQYDFYSVLSEKEVRIPDAEISAQARAEQQQKQVAPAAARSSTTVAPSMPASPRATTIATQSVTAAPASAVTPTGGQSGYLLQVGAFPNATDAEALKAKLAFQGLVANVQTVTIGGQAYHRVRLGPFRSATELEATKQRLASAGIPGIALKEGQ